MKTLVLLRPGHEPVRVPIEKVDFIVALDYPSGIIKVRMKPEERNDVEYLGYMIEFE